MGLRKGQTNNKAGRPKGVPNKITADLKQRIENILDAQFSDEKITSDLKQMEPQQRLQLFTRLLEFCVPKMRASDITLDIGAQIDGMSDSDLIRLCEMIINSQK